MSEGTLRDLPTLIAIRLLEAYEAFFRSTANITMSKENGFATDRALESIRMIDALTAELRGRIPRTRTEKSGYKRLGLHELRPGRQALELAFVEPLGHA